MIIALFREKHTMTLRFVIFLNSQATLCPWFLQKTPDEGRNATRNALFLMLLPLPPHGNWRSLAFTEAGMFRRQFVPFVYGIVESFMVFPVTGKQRELFFVAIRFIYIYIFFSYILGIFVCGILNT